MQENHPYGSEKAWRIKQVKDIVDGVSLLDVHRALKECDYDPLKAIAYLNCYGLAINLHGNIGKKDWAIGMGVDSIKRTVKHNKRPGHFRQLQEHLDLYEADPPDNWIGMMVDYYNANHRRVFDLWMYGCVVELYDVIETQLAVIQGFRRLDAAYHEVDLMFRCREACYEFSWGVAPDMDIMAPLSRFRETVPLGLFPQETGRPLMVFYYMFDHEPWLAMRELFLVIDEFLKRPAVDRQIHNYFAFEYRMYTSHMLRDLFMQYMDNHPIIEQAKALVEEDKKQEQAAQIADSLELALFEEA